jgi:hypothetical protein
LLYPQLVTQFPPPLKPPRQEDQEIAGLKLPAIEDITLSQDPSLRLPIDPKILQQATRTRKSSTKPSKKPTKKSSFAIKANTDNSLPTFKNRGDSIERKILVRQNSKIPQQYPVWIDDLKFLGRGKNMMTEAVGNREFEAILSTFKGKERRSSDGDNDLKKLEDEFGLKFTSDRGSTSIAGLKNIEEEVTPLGEWESKIFLFEWNRRC